MQEVQNLEGDIDVALIDRLKQLKGSKSAKMGVLTSKKN